LLAYPILGVVTGAILTAYLIPKISKQWRKPKELELKMTIVTRMTDSVAGIISSTFLDMVTELMNDESFKDAQRKWEKDKEGVEAQLHVLFPKSEIISEWESFAFAISGLIGLNLEKDTYRRKKYLEQIQKLTGIEIRSNELDALIRKDFAEPGKSQYADAWLHLKKSLKEQMNLIIDKIRKSKIADI
jgi:hypothetical protein